MRMPHTNSKSKETLQALGIIPRPQSLTPTSITGPAPKLEESDHHTTLPPRLRRLPSSTPLPNQHRPAPSPPNASPPPNRSQSVLPVPTPDDGLSKDEIIAMITVYRGHSTGLTNQNTKSLFGLLKYYEVSISRFLPATIPLTRYRPGIITTCRTRR
jgi:hypothetical protein